MHSVPTIRIHADESCLGNQFRDRSRPGGAGGLFEERHDSGWRRWDYWVSEPSTTNNRMALRSALEALALLDRSSQVLFVSDSQYLVRGMTEWLPAWKARGWKRKSGPIENLESWKALHEATQGHDIVWRWVRGHDGHPKNEYANHLATRAARVQDASGGLVPSAFDEWIEEERAQGRYLETAEPSSLDDV